MNSEIIPYAYRPELPAIIAHAGEKAAWCFLGITDDKDGPLFRTAGRATGIQRRMVQKDAYKITEPRAQGWNQNQSRQSQLAHHRHHRLPQKRRLLSDESSRDGELLRHSYDAALRPARGCGLHQRV